MPHHEPNPTATSERGASIALIFALLAERLRIHYEHDKWLNQAQCTALAADWLARSKRNMPLQTHKHLADMSDLGVRPYNRHFVARSKRVKYFFFPFPRQD